jgi:2-polyprenyl-3-methyl-5-hydroxy-6-metoxy-1,4-benzoquinol methylase
VKRRLLTLLDPLLQSGPARAVVTTLVKLWSSSTSRLPADEALRRLFLLDDHLRERIDELAIDLDGGIHAKHRLIGYHSFFRERVLAGNAVLDVGCGKGELAADLASVGANVTGIDVNRGSLAFARSRFADSGVEFVEADVLAWRPPHDFDVIVLSNVLEHIAPRVELLRRLREQAHPGRFLIRVPSRERDWIVPLRDELGLAWYSDPTHETEYTVEQLTQELADAGLQLDELVQRWGELWASASPAQQRIP